MSTSWNAHCTAHPEAGALLYDDWQGSGDHGARQIDKIWQQRETLIPVFAVLREIDGVEAEIEVNGYLSFGFHAQDWMTAHKDCPVIYRNEYGDRVEAGTFEPLPPNHCPTCTCAPKGVDKPVVTRDPCGCVQNAVGDIRCHTCGEYVNVRCRNCQTVRAHRRARRALKGVDEPTQYAVTLVAEVKRLRDENQQAKIENAVLIERCAFQLGEMRRLAGQR